jgi:hypothetical protein
VRNDDDEKPRGLVPDVRWVRDEKGKRRRVEDEVDPETWKSRRKERDGWRNGAKIKR